MSLDKAIEHGKEHRKPYKFSKAIDKQCRNHGSCAYCKGNRTYKFRKAELKGTTNGQIWINWKRKWRYYCKFY